MSLAEQMRKDIPRFGGQVVAEEIYNTDERDFYSVLTKVRARQPEAIYLAGLMDAGVQVIRQAAEVGLKTQLVGSGSMMSDKLIQLTGNASEGFAVSSMFEPSTPNAFGQKFTRMFRERYKKEPDVFTALGYDSMHLLIEAAPRRETRRRTAARRVDQDERRAAGPGPGQHHGQVRCEGWIDLQDRAGDRPQRQARLAALRLRPWAQEHGVIEPFDAVPRQWTGHGRQLHAGGRWPDAGDQHLAHLQLRARRVLHAGRLCGGRGIQPVRTFPRADPAVRGHVSGAVRSAGGAHDIPPADGARPQQQHHCLFRPVGAAAKWRAGRLRRRADGAQVGPGRGAGADRAGVPDRPARADRGAGGAGRARAVSAAALHLDRPRAARDGAAPDGGANRRRERALRGARDLRGVRSAGGPGRRADVRRLPGAARQRRDAGHEGFHGHHSGGHGQCRRRGRRGLGARHHRGTGLGLHRQWHARHGRVLPRDPDAPAAPARPVRPIHGAVLMRKPLAIAIGALALSALLLPAFAADGYVLSVGVTIFIYAMLAVSLDLVLGWAGQFSFAHAAFFGIGAYTAAIAQRDFGAGFWSGLPAGIAVAAVCGLLLGLPALRLRGHFLSIVTIAFQTIVYLGLTQWTSLTGGQN